MQEIFRKLNPQNQTEKTEIEIHQNPQNIIGGSVTREHRLIYFENVQSEPFYIDFVPYHGITNTIYLIPSGHLLYLPISTTNFHCIDVPHSCINDMEKYWIFNLKYKNEKSIPFDTNNIKLHNRIITQVLTSRFTQEQNIPSLQYIQFAEKLSHLIFQSNITHKLTTQSLFNELGITDKTLQRVCNTVYSVKPISLIRYHLLLKTTFTIISKKLTPFHQIADELQFEEVSAFNRYIKAILQHSPTAIREQYNHIIL